MNRVHVCVLPDDADIVRGFVGGGSGLLSMIVPEIQRSFTSYLPGEFDTDYYLPMINGEQSNTPLCRTSTASEILKTYY